MNPSARYLRSLSRISLRPRRYHLLLPLTLALGCAGDGCDQVAPLPSQGLPADQTIEGGAQVRLSAAGFGKLESLTETLMGDALAGGFCLPPVGALGVEFCGANSGSCAPGCEVIPSNLSIDLSSPTSGSQDVLNVRATLDANTIARADGGVLGACDLPIDIDGLTLDIAAPLQLNPTTGVLELPEITREMVTVNLPSPSYGQCGIVDDIIGAVDGALLPLLEDVAAEQVGAQLGDALAGFLPDPLGIEGSVDVAALAGGLSPHAAGLEVRAFPGGFVSLSGGGLTLGGIIGLNSDRDPLTRTRDLDSEVARCVPPQPTLDFGAAPYGLATTSRGTFVLDPAGALVGQPDPAADVLLALSSTSLDLIGHHAVTSGALCLEVDGSVLPSNINLGTIALLVPSVGSIGQGDEPLLLGFRPSGPIGIDIGDGSPGSPALTLDLDQVELDFYGYLFERYIRLFTVRLSTQVGIDIEFTTTESGAPAIMPVLTGLDSASITAEAINTDFLREDAAEIAAVVPPIVDLAAPFLGDALGPFELPAVAGFTLTDLRTTRLVTDEDVFLGVLGDLGPAPADQPEPAGSLAASAAASASSAPARAETEATLVAVNVPSPAAMRAALMRATAPSAPMGTRAEVLPEVVIEVADRDRDGRKLEWTWNLNGGMWRPFTDANPLVIRTPALAFEGEHTVELKARVAGDYRTLDLDPEVISFTIDLPDDAPQAGDPDASEPSAGGCASGTDYGPLSWLLVLGLIALVRPRRVAAQRLSTPRPSQRQRRHSSSAGVGALALLMAASLPTALQVGCGSDSRDPAGGVCESHPDCDASCDAGSIGFCLSGSCECLDELPYGRLGRYTDLALSTDGEIWLSGYSDLYGDLVVTSTSEVGSIPDDAWIFAAGVPDGPVAIERSQVRGGIRAAGDDVGRYTDIAAHPDGGVLVAYFDATDGALGFARFDGESWVSHTVDASAEPGRDDPEASAIVGRYASLSLRPDTGRPSIAYQAEIKAEDGSVRSQVRYASAIVDQPASAQDWTFYVVDELTIPAPEGDEGDEASADPIPRGTGLYLASARARDQTPVLVYYNREQGDLMVARYDRVAGNFAAPEVLDDGGGTNVGLYPAVAVGERDELYVSYSSATDASLLFIDTDSLTPTLVDDGYREAGTTEDGLPKPALHRVGADSDIVLTQNGPIVLYQDASALELRMAYRDQSGKFAHAWVAGGRGQSPGYGFYNAAEFDGKELVIATWVLDPPTDQSWVEIIRQRPLGQ